MNREELLKKITEKKEFSQLPKQDIELAFDELSGQFVQQRFNRGGIGHPQIIHRIDQAASEEFDASQFKDEVREKTLDLIQQKIDGQEITAAPAEESKTKIIDLMAALKASIEEEAAEAPKSKKKASTPKRSTRKKAASG